jgi:NAD(P)-dependent dehydrogenase (short-subunit alcohol dehydrogenase family)
MKIENAVVLVTGSNRGLGLSLVKASLAAGARHVYAGAREPRSLAALVSEGSGRVTPLGLDVTSSESLARAAEQAPDVTLLINNAGVLASYGVLTSTAQQLAQDFAVNCFGMLSTSQAFLPALERAAALGHAALVNVLSVVSLASIPGLGGYSASKAAAFSLTQALRGEFSKKRIRVHAALAGSIDTDMVRAMDMPKESPDSVARGILTGIEQDQEDIFPDPMSRQLHAVWKADPKQLERQFASMFG